MYSAIYLNIIQLSLTKILKKDLDSKKWAILLFVMHFAMKDDPLAEAFAVLILDLQAAEGASPFLHGGVRHWGLASLNLASGKIWIYII